MGFPEGQQWLTVKHIFEKYQPSDYDRTDPEETDEELWERKRVMAGVKGLDKDIRKNGIAVPISLGYEYGSQNKPQIVGGHHRLAVAHSIDPEMKVPVWTGVDDALEAKMSEIEFKKQHKVKQGT